MLRHILSRSSLLKAPVSSRMFAAMDQIDYKRLEHTFDTKLEFRDSADKFSCFRVIDENGQCVNSEFENAIEPEKLKKMLETMVTSNEADIIFN